jgi:hypothetical protein
MSFKSPRKQCDPVIPHSNTIKRRKVYRNSHKLKITLATGSCSKGDFDKTN